VDQFRSEGSLLRENRKEGKEVLEEEDKNGLGNKGLEGK